MFNSMRLFRLKFAICLILCVVFNNSCGQKTNAVNNSDHAHTNRLVDQSSPYLLQHAHNPVDWYPWGEEALTKAKEEGKLMIISIGYAACHWCHVMEKESFEDSTVASIMNEHFISIKVDREERPDVDQIYQEASQLLRGDGGWPLNAIALPDGRPIFAGTYFDKERWMNLLERVQDIYKATPEKAVKQAEDITNGINSIGLVALNEDNPAYTLGDMETVFTNWKPIIDYELGGQKRAPKFPMPIGQHYLMNHAYLTGDEEAKRAVLTTLDKMMEGGIYDQIGGGFARYSTDIYWKVPHFEKMLYDNGQLVSLYAHAYQLTKQSGYKDVVYQTLDFVARELTSEEGAFYSSLDADSEGEEGKFYVWEKEEFDRVVGEDKGLVHDFYAIEANGNWEEGKNILYRNATLPVLATAYNMTDAEVQAKIENANRALLKAREERVRPGLDDKALTSWNSIMIKGYVDAYRVFGEERFLEAALKNAALLKAKVIQSDYRLTRNYKDGKASINGFLDDYAFTIEAFIALYQATFEEKWIFEAEKLVEYSLAHFYNEANGMFFFTSDLDDALVARKMEVPDNVIPSSNSTMAKNLYLLGEYLYKEEWIKKSKQMLDNVMPSLAEGGPYYGNWHLLASWQVKKPYEVAIVGDDFEAQRRAFDQEYLPNAFLMGGKQEGKLPLLENKLMEGRTTIYVCQNKSCRLPVTEASQAIKQILN